MTTSNFQDLLKQERIRRGLSQEDLAKKIGTTRITIHRWEHGSTLPTTYFWARLSKLLGKPIEELFPETPEECLDDPISSIMLSGTSNSVFVSPTTLSDDREFKNEQVLLYPASALPQIGEQDRLLWEMQRLELAEKRMELQQKQFFYACNKIQTVLEVLEPQIDPEVRKMVLEATFTYLESLPLDKDEGSIPLPPIHWIKKTLEVIKKEQILSSFPKKGVNITFETVENALERLQNPSLLGESDLVHMYCVSSRFKQNILTPAEKGMVVREVLTEAFDRLRGTGYRNDTEPAWRAYNILYYRYFKHRLKNDMIVARMDFTSNRQFFRAKKTAIEALLSILLEMEANEVRIVHSSPILPDQQ